MVFDASTLILLAKVGMLEFVVERHPMIVSPAVHDEATRLPAPEARHIARLIREGKIAVRKTAEGTRDIRRLQEDFNLAEGEASSLWLASRLGVLVATDDGPAIRAAKIIGVRFVTAIHLLIEARREGAISTELALAKLEKLESVGRYGQKILETARIRLLE